MKIEKNLYFNHYEKYFLMFFMYFVNLKNK